MGAHVKNTVTSRKNLRPHTSDSAPMSGALRKDRMPLMPITRPFMRNVWFGNVWLSFVMTGMVRRPQAKNSRKMTTRACHTLGSPIPEFCVDE